MRYGLIFTLFIILQFGLSTQAQTSISGFVTEQGSSKRLAFVNVGIKWKNIGTVTDVNGNFILEIPSERATDTLTFSMVGYYENSVSIWMLKGLAVPQVALKLKSVELPSVTITDRRLVETSFGINKSRALVHFTDGSINQKDIFEIAQVINLDTAPSRITSLNLHVNESRKDSGIFRINFYRFDNGKPGERLIEKSILQTKAINEGWLKFDLSEHNIYLKDQFVVAIEFLPDRYSHEPIYYEVKLGGSAKSFVRTNSQGEWSVPPHHYRMYLTAFVPGKKSEKDEENSEERESVPSFSLYSQNVKDSFYIFVSKPPTYKQGKRYPVLYLLDANAYFDLVAASIKEQRKEVILIGVGYKNAYLMDSLRERDYTYPKALPTDSFLVSGGGGRFLSFMENELVPLIDRTFTTDSTKRTLMGHSLGGYFVLYSLDQSCSGKRNLFKNYVAASPSLDYGRKYLFRQFQGRINPENSVNILFTFGGREDLEDGRDPKNGSDDFDKFAKLLSDGHLLNINVTKQKFQNFDHMETAVPTFVKALQLYY